jgi:light-regulated signal transduction histidine kinase (bacteriophytochrome)
MNDTAGLIKACEDEPIHIPGSIQPYGLMLAAEREKRAIVAVAGNVETRLGVVDWQGRPLAHILGEGLDGKVTALLESNGAPGYLGLLRTRSGEMLDVSAYLSGDIIVVELEPASPNPAPASELLNQLEVAAVAFENATTLQALCERATEAFRQITGFDRVMVYRFEDDEAGRVLAESRRQDLQTFLNHHFPASDIPTQARALYVRNLIRVIPDIAYTPALLRPFWRAPDPLDMSQGNLRSVSPVHLQYLSNMGVRASASVSIVRDGLLWGLIACHNETRRQIPYEVRIACRSLAAGLARQIKAKEEAEGYRQRIRLRSFEEDIIALLSREGTLDETLANHLGEVGTMLGADGVAVLRGTEAVLAGLSPALEDVRRLADWVLARPPGGAVFSTNNLEAVYAPGSSFRETGSGVLALILSADESWLLLWFRAEHVEVVNWAGNPHKAVDADPRAVLTPRASFDAWQEIVRGNARRWTLPELEAAHRMRTAILDVQQTRRLRDLNRQLTQILHEKDELLEQKDFLIGEVNHRVQNSLQLVSSFLGLQSRTSESPEVKFALGEARRRLSAVVLVHRRLYRGDQIQFIDASRYIQELCADAIASMGEVWAKQISLDLAPVIISTDRAVTVGLVVTELIININKYAYAGEPGSIEIRLTEERNFLRLTIADRGVGRLTFRKGFGSRLMDGLVGQLGGTLTYSDNQPGLRATLLVPVQDQRTQATAADVYCNSVDRA